MDRYLFISYNYNKYSTFIDKFTKKSAINCFQSVFYHHNFIDSNIV